MKKLMRPLTKPLRSQKRNAHVSYLLTLLAATIPPKSIMANNTTKMATMMVLSVPSSADCLKRPRMLFFMIFVWFPIIEKGEKILSFTLDRPLYFSYQ